MNPPKHYNLCQYRDAFTEGVRIYVQRMRTMLRFGFVKLV